MMSLKSKIDLGVSIIRAKISRQNKPLFVQFSVTNRCNKKCVYCDYPLREQKELSTKEVFLIIDDLANMGTKRINLLGGEPLLREDISKIVEYIRNKKIQCVMTSNGTLVPGKLNIIRKLNQLTLSLDGDEETNDKNRGRGSFGEVMEAANFAKRVRVPFQISMLLTKNNIDSMDFMLKKAQELRCMVSINIPYHSPENGRSALALMAGDGEYKKAIRKIIDAKKRGLPVLFSIPTYNHTLNWPSYREDMVMQKSSKITAPPCYAGRYFGYIDTNGDFYPCILFNGNKKFDSLNCIKDGVKKAWDNCNIHSCCSCFIPCYVEYNYIFSLNRRTVLNMFFNYMKFR